jgi:hypothetical protein
MKRPGGFRRIGGDHIGRLAIPVFQCNGCGAEYKASAPSQCLACGRLDFTKIDSGLEAARIAELRLRQRAGEIAELRTQVSFDLTTSDVNTGLEVVVARYVADATYLEAGALVIVDIKPRARDGKILIDPVSKLKHRWMAARGLPVTILT